MKKVVRQRKKLAPDTPPFGIVDYFLRQRWSPEQIGGTLRRLEVQHFLAQYLTNDLIGDGPASAAATQLCERGFKVRVGPALQQ